jgi:predicted RNA polymerase sigma factor
MQMTLPALITMLIPLSIYEVLLKKLGRLGEARAEFERAAELTRNVRERSLLLDRARECTSDRG